MKKTINVNIAGRIFYVEEDAYSVLDTYLKEVKAHFEKFQDSEEILKDIETRIAEQLMPGTKDATPIVNLETVQKVIATMGSPKDFTETEEGLPKKEPGKQQSQEPPNRTKFFRDTDNAILGGVASGIAVHFDMDPLWIRLAFVLVTLAGGSGILLYIVLWIIMPPAETTSQKLEMRGDRLTLEAIEKSVKEKIINNLEARKSARKVGSAIHSLVTGIGRFFKIIASTLFKIIGTFLTIGVIFAIIGLFIATIAAISGGSSPYIEFPLRDFFGSFELSIAVLTGFFLVLVPLVLLLTLGISFIAGKNKFHPLPTVSIVVLWLIAAGTATALGVRNAPRVEEFAATHPVYKQITTNTNVNPFTKLELEHGMQVTLKQGPEYLVNIEAVQRDHNRIHPEVQDGTLRIVKEETRENRWCILCIHESPHITIIAPNFESITAENAIRINGKDLVLDNVYIHLSNASRLDITLNADTIEAWTENGSRINLAGKSQSLTAHASNTSRIDASGLTAVQVNAEASNGSTITVYPTGQLIVRASNGSRIRYIGTPTYVEGNAKQLEDDDYSTTNLHDSAPNISPINPPPSKPTTTPPASKPR